MNDEHSPSLALVSKSEPFMADVEDVVQACASDFMADRLQAWEMHHCHFASASKCDAVFCGFKQVYLEGNGDFRNDLVNGDIYNFESSLGFYGAIMFNHGQTAGVRDKDSIPEKSRPRIPNLERDKRVEK